MELDSMRRMVRGGLSWLGVGLVLAGAASAQGVSGVGQGAWDEHGWLGYRRGEVWKDPPVGVSGRSLADGSETWPRLGAADLGAARFEVGDGAEELAARLGVEPPPVSREGLEGTGEELQRYHGLPGGIVLGLEARPIGWLAEACGGARIENRTEGGSETGLALRLADGRSLRLPAIEPETLRALLEFSAGTRDALVDLHGDGAAPRLAPAFAGGALAEELVRLDRLPHRLRPETRVWKTLIVDRAVRFEARGDELVLSADLELRLYAPDLGSGWAARAGAIEAAGVDFIGPRTSGDMGVELAPLAELAAWLGFLRWARQLDSATFPSAAFPNLQRG